MATIKSYSDLEQSKKLAEILPLETADMHYNNASIKGINYVDEHRAELMEYNRAIKVLSKYTINPLFEVIPCWSLAALLRIIREKIGYTLYGVDVNNVYMSCNFLGNKPLELETELYDNEVDACYEMIIKLHELNLL